MEAYSRGGNIALAVFLTRVFAIRLATVTLFTFLLILSVTLSARTVQAQETAVCEQYGCGDASSEEAPVPTSVSPSADVSSSDEATAQDDVAPSKKVTPISETSTQKPKVAKSSAGRENGASVPFEHAENTKRQEVAYREAINVKSKDQNLKTTKGRMLSSSPYPYPGEECKVNDCGLGFGSEPTCAKYETTSGKTVIGCSISQVKDRGCYEIYWHTTQGKRYANLDTCEGEKAYAPPEPPKGRFTYWEPQENDNDTGRGTANCVGINGKTMDDHCGLKNVPTKYACEVFFDTVHGTVRGCYDDRGYDGTGFKPGMVGCGDVTVYDEVGRPLDTHPYCPEKVRYVRCEADRCGVGKKVPPEWECSTKITILSELYGSERLVETRCAHPRYEEFLDDPPRNGYKKPCVRYFDERGKLTEVHACDPQGVPDIVNRAKDDADQANQTLTNGHRPIEQKPELPPIEDGRGKTGPESRPIEDKSSANKSDSSIGAKSLPTASKPEEGDRRDTIGSRGNKTVAKSPQRLTKSTLPAYSPAVRLFIESLEDIAPKLPNTHTDTHLQGWDDHPVVAQNHPRLSHHEAHASLRGAQERARSGASGPREKAPVLSEKTMLQTAETPKVSSIAQSAPSRPEDSFSQNSRDYARKVQQTGSTQENHSAKKLSSADTITPHVNHTDTSPRLVPVVPAAILAVGTITFTLRRKWFSK